MTVSDNGCGTNCNPLLSSNPTKRDSGYGLKNVNDRIKLAYGNDCELTFESKVGAGTTVKIKIRNNYTEDTNG